jgi:hypothetical protein
MSDKDIFYKDMPDDYVPTAFFPIPPATITVTSDEIVYGLVEGKLEIDTSYVYLPNGEVELRGVSIVKKHQEKQPQKNLFILNLLWKLTPNWLGHLFIYLSGGWVWTQKVDHETGKPLRYYWQRREEIKHKNA